MSEPETMIAAFYQSYNAHDVPAAVGLYSDDGAHTDIAGGRTRAGRAELEAGLRGFFDMLPDVTFEVTETVLSRDSAVVFYRMEGHIGRDFGTMPTKGKAIELTGVHVFAFESDRIKATTDYWNEADFKKQLSA